MVRGQRSSCPRTGRAGALRVVGALLVPDRRGRAPRLPRARRPVRPLAFTKVEVGGRGRAAYLQRLAANDVDREPSAIVYTAMLAPRAGIMCDLTVTRLAEDRFLVVTGGAVGRHDLAWMRRNLPEDGSVHLEDRTSGPAASACGGRGRATSPPRQRGRPLQRGLPIHGAREAHIGYVPVPDAADLLRRRARLGDDAPTEFGPLLLDTLWEAGSRTGVAAAAPPTIAAPGEGLPAVGRRHRQGDDPTRRASAGRSGSQGRLHRPRRRRARSRSDGVRPGCAPWSSTTPRWRVGKEPLLAGDEAASAG